MFVVRSLYGDVRNDIATGARIEGSLRRCQKGSGDVGREDATHSVGR